MTVQGETARSGAGLAMLGSSSGDAAAERSTDRVPPSIASSTTDRGAGGKTARARGGSYSPHAPFSKSIGGEAGKISGENSWRECLVFFSRTLIDGSRDCGVLMRRRVNGGWQYRRMTAAEELEHAQSTAW